MPQLKDGNVFGNLEKYWQSLDRSSSLVLVAQTILVLADPYLTLCGGVLEHLVPI